MEPITEFKLRYELKDSLKEEYIVPPNGLLTPSARDYLNNRNIKIISLAINNNLLTNPKSPKSRYLKNNHLNLLKKANLKEKPEGLTHLYGQQLVSKDHLIIIYRGQLDFLNGKIIQAQIRGLENQNYVDDLEEILSFLRGILAAEIQKKPLTEFNILGFSAADLREQSHQPKKFFARNHILMSYKMGPLCVDLNSLRTETRKVELAAFKAFKIQEESYQTKRDDIILALNRLSSLFYILIFKYLPSGFKTEDAGI